MGISVSRSLFPVQALALDPHFGTVRLHRTLREAGVQTLLVRNRKTSGVKLFVFNASHSIGDVDQATMLLDAAIRVQCQRVIFTGQLAHSLYPGERAGAFHGPRGWGGEAQSGVGEARTLHNKSVTTIGVQFRFRGVRCMPGRPERVGKRIASRKLCRYIGGRNAPDCKYRPHHKCLVF
jgi:hypothetical protein